MNSNVTEDSVQRGRLLIHIAENGRSFELDCDGSTPVEAVQRFMESTAGIQLSDQLLLCLDLKLESNESLSAYKLPSDEQEVFCFNKARLQANAPLPQAEQVEMIDIAEPLPPSSTNNPHPLDHAVDPALKALPSYERQFRYHYQCGDAIYRGTFRKFDNCQRLLREQTVQERGMEIARRNLDHFYRILNQNYMDFLKCYSQQYKLHADLLANFARDIDKLRSCKLIPSLQTSSRKCLLDLVREDNLRKWLENCSTSHKQFENKVSQFKHEFGRLKQDVEDLFSSKASLPIKDLDLLIKDHHRHISEQRSIMQSLSKDVSTVKKLVDDCLTSQLSASLRPHDAVSALGPMYDVHEKNHLPRMRASDHSISDLLDFFLNKKNEMNIFVHGYMKKIAYIQHKIKDVRLQFNAFSEALKRQDVLFEGLRVVRGLGPAYRACLAEVVRRKASMKLYMGMAGQLAEKLAAKREIEVRRREEFQKAQSLYIPRDVFASMGLFDIPSQCDVNMVPFDTNLLDIDIADIDRYAPEYLVGLPFKTEKSGTPRSSVSISNHSSHSSELEANERQKHDSQELFEGCELVEIAGTSKMEVENARLKAELASAIAVICSFSPEVEYETLDDGQLDSVLKNAAVKTAEALQLKDEYAKHLMSKLRATEKQCDSYEKRIQDLEQKLSNQYTQGHKFPDDSGATCLGKPDECKSEISVQGEPELPCISSEPMDELFCTSNLVDSKLESSAKLTSRTVEGVDENMTDSPGINSHIDSSMMESQREELTVAVKDDNQKMVEELAVPTSNSDCIAEPIHVLAARPSTGSTLGTELDSNLLAKLQSAVDEKTKQLAETENSLKSAVDEVSKLGRELEISRKLLNESQMNCAHLENCLHEAREEAETHRCAADRRASQYSALRASAVKMHGLFERLKSCVTSSAGVAGFADSLRSMSLSLAHSANEKEGDGAAEFCAFIKVLADKVDILARQRGELLERNSKAEAANKHLLKELEEKKELVKTLYTKHQLEKLANKEKISFCRFEVHEIAAFVLNSSGHYETISRNLPNYYLSAESVALFTDHLPCRPAYIVGQIVHIERQIVKSLPALARPEHNNRGEQGDNSTPDTATTTRLTLNSGSTSNPYGLPIGCEYFVVTVAMLPDTTIHSPPPS